jgi:hypothetical protein
MQLRKKKKENSKIAAAICILIKLPAYKSIVTERKSKNLFINVESTEKLK